jgi:hypothetical protein
MPINAMIAQGAPDRGAPIRQTVFANRAMKHNQAHDNAMLGMREREFGMREQAFAQGQQDRAATMQSEQVKGQLDNAYKLYMSGNRDAFRTIAELEGLDEEDLNGLDVDKFVQVNAQMRGLGQAAGEQFTLSPGAARYDASGKIVAQQPFAPQSMGAGQQTPASIREHDYFKSLPSDEAREEYLRVKRGEQKPSSGLEKRLFEVHDLAFKARSNVDKYTRIGDEMQRVMPAGGVRGAWTEGYKELMGSQDAVTELRKAWNEIRVSGAINNLPPGVASDKDIALAMSAFLPETANAETVASFLRGLAKMEGIKADYHEFEADYLSTHSSPVGMNKAWKALAGEMYSGQGGQAAPASAGPGGQRRVRVDAEGNVIGN